MSLFRDTGWSPPAKVSRSMIGERVPAWTALVFAQRRRKLEAYSPTDSVSPCWRLKNAPARVEESRCSPQCCSRMAKILPGVLTSSAPMDSTSCLARPSSAPRSQAAATGSAMGPSSRNNFASLTKSSAASPSSPENRRSLWGLKLWSVGGAGGWPGLSAAFMVKIGLCCCLCEDRSRVAAPLILLSQRQSCNGMASGQRTRHRQRSHHGHRDMGSSPSAGPLTAASLSNAAGGQRSRGAILWHPAGRHRHFGEKMSRRSGPGRQGAHRAEHAATQKAAASLGGDERPPFMFPSGASFGQRGPLVSSGCRPRGSIAAANNHPGRRADHISLPLIAAIRLLWSPLYWLRSCVLSCRQRHTITTLALREQDERSYPRPQQVEWPRPRPQQTTLMMMASHRRRVPQLTTRLATITTDDPG